MKSDCVQNVFSERFYFLLSAEFMNHLHDILFALTLEMFNSAAHTMTKREREREKGKYFPLSWM